MDPVYPKTQAERRRWIQARRGRRSTVDPWSPAACLVEEEPDGEGGKVDVTTLFLINRECPWRCLMCDLWRHALPGPTPPGALPVQIRTALAARKTTTPQIKLYNSGSFFDPRAVPVQDHPAIARSLADFDRVVVECHPALVDDRVFEFRDRLAGRLEVAMGLETVHPEVLRHLNKQMTVDSFGAAAGLLRRQGVDLRAFILVQPPFLGEDDPLLWAERSVRFAQACHARVTSLIPTRPGNGAIEALIRQNLFHPPHLSVLEQALDRCLQNRQGLVLADLWDLEQFSTCSHCFPARLERLRRTNFAQRALPAVACAHCT